VSFAPKIRSLPTPAVEPPSVQQLVEVIREQIVVKEAVQPRGWRFVPYRDADNLIVEIIATPIE
jgi:hypothetical protein